MEGSSRRRKLSRLRRAALVLLGLWTLVAILMAVQSHYRYALAGRPITWGYAFGAEFVYAYLWAAATPPILWLATRFPLTRQSWIRNIPLHLLVALSCSLATKAVWDLVFLQPPKRFAAIAWAIDYGFLQYALILLSLYLWDYRRRSAQLEAQLAQAQLAALRMQLHPHFLFNTLHAISELIHQKPAAAERMIVRLSEFLRLTLDQSNIAEVTLRQELDFLHRYLGIEKIRFEDRMQVDIQADPATLEAAVPNFLLQPLVENALRHGLAHRLEGGLLRIGSRRINGRLALSVWDNGPGPGCKQIIPGYGLGLTQERLQRLYGGDHRLELRACEGGGCEVEIEIPWKRYAS